MLKPKNDSDSITVERACICIKKLKAFSKLLNENDNTFFFFYSKMMIKMIVLKKFVMLIYKREKKEVINNKSRQGNK